LRNIGYSLRNVRTMIDGVVPEAIESYTVITGWWRSLPRSCS